MVANFPTAEIARLAHDGRGVAYVEGKTVFIDGALPGEQVQFRYTQRKPQFDQGQVVEILTPSPNRVTPRCIHADICGGCRQQHIDAEAQVLYKQQILLDQLQHFGKLSAPETLLPPITASPWGYRRKARLSVKFVAKKDRVLIGFHEKQGRYIAELTRCETLVPQIGEHLTDLKNLIADLSIYQSIPQIELAAGDNVTVLVLRHLQPLTDNDRLLLQAYAKLHNVVWYLQPGNASTVAPLDQPGHLFYTLPAFDLHLEFSPLDFVQVNGAVNRQLVSRAVELLDIQPQDTVLDLFCGLGNFSLAIARSAAKVVGVEGDMPMVRKAQQNAELNQIDNAQFHMADLSQGLPPAVWAQQKYDKVLIDPPRAGAFEIVQQIARLGAKRIVYVSCDPATFARDAGELVHNQGYQLQHLGVLDMFPHTRHVEAIGVFTKCRPAP